MNRVIKFRGYHKVHKQMFSAEEMAKDQLTIMTIGSFINVSGHSIAESVIFDSEVFIPLQYTGINDKDGAEVFEGDIISLPNRFTNAEEHWTVEYMNEGAMFIIKREKNWKDLIQMSAHIKVVGNIYETPELIPEK